MAKRILGILALLAVFVTPSVQAETSRAIFDAGVSHAVSQAGIAAEGVAVRIRDEDPGRYTRELKGNARVLFAFSIDGRGPTPLRVRLPNSCAPFEIYRRIDTGMWIRIDAAIERDANHPAFTLACPGTYLIAEPESSGSKASSSLFTLPEPLSDQPEAKAHWRLFRAAPDRITGPVPLVLVHGLKSGNWDEFIHWASYSPESAAFRATFQVWNFSHPTAGVNAAVGFSRAYPAFEESIVAYLARFLDQATADGVETDGERYYFPAQGPFCMMAHSFGGIRTLAFLRNYPSYAERVQAVVALGPTMLGSPGATPEWMRHTTSRLRLARAPSLNAVLQGSLADVGLLMFMDERKQCDLDGGWVNMDERGGFGIPVRDFRAWKWGSGFEHVMLSPRDANATDARSLPGYSDYTFEPAQPLSTYCGGLDEILPTERGDPEIEKYFIYASYLDRPRDWTGLTAGTSKALTTTSDVFVQNALLLFTNALMTLVASQGSDVPLGAYVLNDGLVPLQSQLMLDGTQTSLPYATRVVNGWRVPVLPYRPNWEMIREHTMANPDRIRVLKNWTHLDTLTGRYNIKTGHSTLFSSAAEDLLSVMSGND